MSITSSEILKNLREDYKKIEEQYTKTGNSIKLPMTINSPKDLQDFSSKMHVIEKGIPREEEYIRREVKSIIDYLNTKLDELSFVDSQISYDKFWKNLDSGWDEFNIYQRFKKEHLQSE